jgi:hypothetical protein
MVLPANEPENVTPGTAAPYGIVRVSDASEDFLPPPPQAQKGSNISTWAARTIGVVFVTSAILK